MRTPLLLVVTWLVLSNCGMSAPATSVEGASSVAPTDPTTPDPTNVAAAKPDPNPKEGTAATLTAGIWDDSLNFDLFTAYRDQQVSPLANFTVQEQLDASQVQRTATSALDLVLVVDTTGSMGDELSWLTTDFASIADEVETAHPGVPQRWALVHYRDLGDDYVVSTSDFTSDRAGMQRKLAALRAGGGGDFPEAVEQALAQAAQLTWSTTPGTAKLAFWVADAPPHDDRAAAYSTAVRALRDQGIHLYPVASSGVEARTQYAMRAAAQLTQGRYIFLTDDSHIGNAHETPAIACFVVTTLTHAVLRAIDSELAGSRVAIDPARVIRTVGNPTPDGQCALPSGANAKLF